MNTPPLYIGAILLFWGYEAQQLILAAVMAAFVEGSRVFKLRWDFKDDDFNRASDLSILGLIGLGTYRLLTGWYNHPAWMMVIWLPVVLLPMFLAQVYSHRQKVNLAAISLIKRKQANRPSDKPILVDLSYSYALVTIVAAGAANVRTHMFFIGVAVFMIWGIWTVRSSRWPVGVWFLAIIAAVGLGYGGHKGLSGLQTIVTQQTIDWFSGTSSDISSPYSKFNKIGEIGSTKLSNRIVFRAHTNDRLEKPLLLAEAFYDTYRSRLSLWGASQNDFRPISAGAEHGTWNLTPSGSAPTRCRIAQHLRGHDEMLKLPHGAVQITDLPLKEIRRNDLGTVVTTGVGLSIYDVVFGSEASFFAAPTAADMELPDKEGESAQRIVAQLGLHNLPRVRLLDQLNDYFMGNYRYSLERQPKKRGYTTLQNFMEYSRAGHCEFFAASAVMILRACGVPARYVRGYALDPHDRMGYWYLVRSRHAHAWALAYIGDRWITFDPTPGTWQHIERTQMPWLINLQDAWAALTFQLAQWRQAWEEGHHDQYLPFILIPLIAFLGWRLLGRRKAPLKRVKTKAKEASDVSTVSWQDSAIYQLERFLNQNGYFRSEWETMAQWMERIGTSTQPSIRRRDIEQALALHYRYRYDPDGLAVQEKDQMESIVSKWIAQYRDSKGSPRTGFSDDKYSR